MGFPIQVRWHLYIWKSCCHRIRMNVLLWYLVDVSAAVLLIPVSNVNVIHASSYHLSIPRLKSYDEILDTWGLYVEFGRRRQSLCYHTKQTVIEIISMEILILTMLILMLISVSMRTWPGLISSTYQILYSFVALNMDYHHANIFLYMEFVESHIDQFWRSLIPFTGCLTMSILYLFMPVAKV